MILQFKYELEIIFLLTFFFFTNLQFRSNHIFCRVYPIPAAKSVKGQRWKPNTQKELSPNIPRLTALLGVVSCRAFRKLDHL